MIIMSLTCLCYPERANSMFLLRNIATLEFGQKRRQNRLQASRYKPDHQSKLSAPAWAYKGRASTLEVGFITNKFHRVLVYIYVQVAYAWKWEENAPPKTRWHIVDPRQQLLDESDAFTRIYGPTRAPKLTQDKPIPTYMTWGPT